MLIFIEARGASLSPPRTHRNEFPAEYSLASCSPAALASAFPARLILRPWSPFAKKNPANGSCRIYTLSHKRAHSRASKNPKTPQIATGALVRPKPDIANKALVFNWSGRGDLNARPPAPKGASWLPKALSFFAES
jgi:hypothetical protein